MDKMKSFDVATQPPKKSIDPDLLAVLTDTLDQLDMDYDTACRNQSDVFRSGDMKNAAYHSGICAGIFQSVNVIREIMYDHGIDRQADPYYDDKYDCTEFLKMWEGIKSWMKPTDK